MTETSGRYDRRNFVLNASEGFFFVMGSSLISSQTVFPALIVRLGGDNTLIGAFGVIVWLGLLLPQIFAARYTQTLPWKKPWAVRFGAAQRFVILGIAFIILFSGYVSPSITCILILLLFAINQILTGITTPGWFDMYAKMTPVHRRGRLIGTRTAFAGIGSFGCGFVLTWILARFGFPFNYGLVFAGAFLFQFISILLQSQLVEEHASKTLPRQPLLEYFKQLPGVLHHNRQFRSFLVASGFLIVATIPLNFFTVYGLKRFQGNEGIVGQFTLAIVVGQFIGSILNGYIADRFGNRIALIYSSVSMALASVWAFFAPSQVLFELVFIFSGINLGSDSMIRSNLAIEYGPVEQRSTYIGLMNTLLAPLYALSLLAGWIIDSTGYDMVFGIGAASSVIGIFLLITGVSEPRILNR